MKYWILTTEYPPFFGGGISTYCLHTGSMLAQKGHTVTFFVNDNTVKEIKIEQHAAIRIIRFNPSRTNAAAFLGYITNISFEFSQVVKKFIEEEGAPDVIEAQEYLGIAYYLLQFKHMQYDWCKNIPIIITMHSPSFLYMEYNDVPQYRYPNFWVCEMERFCLQAADQIISPSRFMCDELEKRFALTNSNLSIVPNPFPGNVASELLTGTKPGQIVFYGKLTPQKGAFRLLKYFNELWDKGFERPLYLLGGQDIVYHPENKTMGDLIRTRYRNYMKRGLLILENRIRPAEVPQRLAAAELVIIPSNNDNLPYVVFEMMSLGKIVLVSKQGGQTEVVKDGHNGFIFDHTDPPSFERQLLKILELSPEERSRIAGNARDTVNASYSLDAIYTRKLPVIEKAISTGKQVRKEFPFVRTAIAKAVERKSEHEIKGRLSIVVPYYNLGKYLHETIESLSRIDYANREIIILNDGSKDAESIDTLNNYRNHPGIKVIDQPNSGLAEARNAGARASTGEYLAFLDADDTVDPTYYSKAIRILETYENVHFCGCWTQYFDNSEKVWPTFLPEPPLILFHNLVNSSALVYKKSSFLTAGLNDREMLFQGLEDYESVISMTANGLKGVAIPERLFNYRVRPDSMIREISREKKLLLYQYIAEKHKNYYATFAADISNLANANGPGILLDNPTLDLFLSDKAPFGSKLSLRLIRIIKKNRHARIVAYKIYKYFK